MHGFGTMRSVHRAMRLFCCLFLICSYSSAYSVLSHEALVDALWETRLRPILLAHYPNATPEDLKLAHGYAYGGAVIQDLGYYPNGSKQFSDLTHYVRTGDFVLALINESRSLNDLGFALGSLSHYFGDVDGHRYGTNVGEPIEYSKLRKKYGRVITYEQNPEDHIRTEYGFDVFEVARGNFAPQAYHDFIGFYVAKDLLNRAFHDTYGLELADVFKNVDVSVASYRGTVSRLIPTATRIAWAQNRVQIQQARPGMTRNRFVYIMRRSSYEKEWGKQYNQPTLLDRILAFLLRLLPPIGPLKSLRIKVPDPQVQKLFMASFDRATQGYSNKLDDYAANKLALVEANYDVGVVTPAGVYRLEDVTQIYWLHELAEGNFAGVTPAIRSELLGYFGDLSAPMKIRANSKLWKQLQTDYAALKSSQSNQP